MDGDKILLGLKKRGFGKGRWNGAGGKVEDGETFKDATIRECQEEFGITPLSPTLIASIKFDVFHNQEQLMLDVQVFMSTKWEGKPRETEEMRPQWFKLDDIPYDEMWQDDKYWLPQVLTGKKLICSFSFDKNDKMIKKNIEEVTSL